MDEMNKITNDYGNVVNAVGYEGSIQRIMCMYPRATKELKDKMINLYIADNRYTYFDVDEMTSYIKALVPNYVKVIIFNAAYYQFNEWLTRREDFTN